MRKRLMNPDIDKEESSKPKRTYKVLIVENEDVVAKSYKNLIERRWPVKVTITGKGQEAIEIAKKEKPDFTILDINLDDDIKGWQVAKEIRTFNNQMKIIVMAAPTNDSSNILLMGTYSISSILTKPIKLEHFLSHIKSVFESIDSADKEFIKNIYNDVINLKADEFHKIINRLTIIRLHAEEFKSNIIDGIFNSKGFSERQVIDEAIKLSEFAINESSKLIEFSKIIPF